MGSQAEHFQGLQSPPGCRLEPPLGSHMSSAVCAARVLGGSLQQRAPAEGPIFKHVYLINPAFAWVRPLAWNHQLCLLPRKPLWICKRKASETSIQLGSPLLPINRLIRVFSECSRQGMCLGLASACRHFHGEVGECQALALPLGTEAGGCL